MRAVMKRELKNYLRNPILWIGIILVIMGIYQALSPYLQVRYFQSEKETKKQTEAVEGLSEIADADIMQGFVPSDEDQKIKLGCEEIAVKLAEGHNMTEKEAGKIVADMQKKYQTVPEISEYLEKEYGFLGADSYFDLFEYHGGSMEEANGYIDKGLEEHPYSYYFARKFADFGGLFMGFFAAVLLAFLFIRDTRRDTYELLHTKPVSARAYILGKAGGGLAVILLVLAILNVVFGIMCWLAGSRSGFPVRLWDITLATAIYILPNMLMIVSVYTGIALLFKNPLPAMPLLILYMLYSNMGSVGPDGKYGYFGRPLAIMVRFPGKFFETSPPPMVLMNQLFLLGASACLLLLAMQIWKRRRSY